MLAWFHYGTLPAAGPRMDAAGSACPRPGPKLYVNSSE